MRQQGASGDGRDMPYSSLLRRGLLTSIVLASALTPAVAVAQASARAVALAGMSVTELPVATGNTLALFWSGDGGWAEVVDSVSHGLMRAGVSVVGVNSHSWLAGQKRSPDDAARDTERLLRYYLAHWNRTRIMLLGFSRGADFMPFIVNRLSPDLRAQIDVVGMLSAERSASFEFHLVDLVKSTVRPTDLPVRPEVERSPSVRYVCIYGTKAKNAVCPYLDPARITVIGRVGDHHLDGAYEAIAQQLLSAARAGASTAISRE